jgi:lysophospholipase L1-like esterase
VASWLLAFGVSTGASERASALTLQRCLALPTQRTSSDVNKRAAVGGSVVEGAALGVPGGSAASGAQMENLGHNAGGGTASAPPEASPSTFALRDGDRVVFYGDSITEQRLYTTFVESYAVTRFPHLNLRFVHSGWSGDRVSGGLGGSIDDRLARDVFAYQPTVVTVMLGMNDCENKVRDPVAFALFRRGYEHLVASLTEHVPSARVTLLKPSPYDDVTRPPLPGGGLNASLIEQGDVVQALGGRKGTAVADLNTPVVEVLRRAYARDPAGASKLIADRIHPGAALHLVMARALLGAWNAPALVSAVTLDATSATVLSCQGARVWEVGSPSSSAASGGHGTPVMSWKQLDAALPLFIDPKLPGMSLVLACSDAQAALSQQPLAVHGLAPGRYTLLIDATPVGTYTHRQLEAGIDLAAAPTPMLAQAEQVHALTLMHNHLHHTRWRQVQLPQQTGQLARLDGVLRRLDEAEAQVVLQQRALAQPREHSMTIVAAP